jgi:L-ascorbate metabolism protein UlaG (beta-lactamase superfamily)
MNQEVTLKLSTPERFNHQVQVSSDLRAWTPLVTLPSVVGVQSHVDSAAPWVRSRYYRAVQLTATNLVSGDHLTTTNGDVVIHPVNHATFVMQWNGRMIYADPVGGGARFQGLPRADLVLVTHSHGDHFHPDTITAVKGTNAVIVAPASVYQSMSSALKALTVVLTNHATVERMGLAIEAVPAYNLTSSYHPKGVGNGYLLTLGGKRVYVSGDTEDIPELRALREIDVAFICMNLPYTMSVTRAASAVRECRPRVVYVYHYSGYQSADLARVKTLVGTDLGIEVRFRKWY